MEDCELVYQCNACSKIHIDGYLARCCSYSCSLTNDVSSDPITKIKGSRYQCMKCGKKTHFHWSAVHCCKVPAQKLTDEIEKEYITTMGDLELYDHPRIARMTADKIVTSLLIQLGYNQLAKHYDGVLSQFG